jgi:hypothetical protein
MDGSHVIADTRPAWLADLERNARGRTLRTVVHTAGNDWEKLAIVDFDRRRVVSGLACSGAIIHDEVAFAPMGCELSLPPIWFAHEKGKGDVSRLMSRSHRIGETISLMKTPLGVYYEAAIDETPGGNYAWNLISTAHARSSSGGFATLEIASLVNGIRFVGRWRFNEISICTNGADPGATCRIVHDENGVVWP